MEYNKIINHHEIYMSLGTNELERTQAYQSLFSSGLESKDIALIRQSASLSMPAGNHSFKEQIEKALNRKIGHARKGRPVKSGG